MGSLITVVFVVAVTSAARSTWSPCGLSMLSTITPLSERGRGHRYGVTATWFVVGALAGGATLGGGAALGALAVAKISLPTSATLALGAAAALAATAGDLGLAGARFPLFRRQVNEKWLDQYRPWCYGAGFGWQVGIGVATYIMTAAVFLMIALAALTGAPLVALAVCTTFGLVRGLTVFLTGSLRTPQSLRAFHRRFDRLTKPVRLATIGVEVLAAVVLLALFWVPAGIALGTVLIAALTLRRTWPRAPANLPEAA